MAAPIRARPAGELDVYRQEAYKMGAKKQAFSNQVLYQ